MIIHSSVFGLTLGDVSSFLVLSPVLPKLTIGKLHLTLGKRYFKLETSKHTLEFKRVMNMQVLANTKMQGTRGLLFRWNKRILNSFVSASRQAFQRKLLQNSRLFAYVISQKTKRKAAKQKFRNIVYLVKLSIHAKIQLLLNTFKNGRKIKGSFLPWAFQLTSSMSPANAQV